MPRRLTGKLRPRSSSSRAIRGSNCSRLFRRNCTTSPSGWRLQIPINTPNEAPVAPEAGSLASIPTTDSPAVANS
jgi:hypothetical protein